MITLFKNKSQVEVGYHRPMIFALERIKSGASKDIIEKVRAGDKELKTTLPAVCFAGTFNHRSKKGLIEASGFCILDFDKFEGDEMQIWRDTLEANEYIYSCWTSPSGNGIKALVKIPKEPDNYGKYFQAIVDYFDCENLDQTTKDISRLCFESYDPDLYLNEDSDEWTEMAIEDLEDIGTSEPAIELESTVKIIENLLKWWNDKYGFIEGERNANLFKLAAAFNDFGVPQGDAESTLHKFKEDGFSINEIDKLIKSAYKKSHNFGTKYFEDVEKKRKIEKDIIAGKSEKEIQKKYGVKDIETIKKSMEAEDFWYFNKNGTIKLSPHKYKFWLEHHGFAKYYPNKSGAFTFIQKNENLLEETTEKKIKDYVLQYLLKRSDIGFHPYDFMANNPKYFSSEYLSFLDTADVDVLEDTQDSCFIYFRNAVVEVTKDNIKLTNYVDIDGFVWKRQIIDRDFNKVDHHESIFRTFVWLISGEDVERYNSLKSVVGYLLHSFKTSANNKAVIFNDEMISENPNGGSGKGLFWNALSYMKRVSSIDGKTFEFTRSFPYQTVSTDTQVLVFDDVKKNFNFESLFSLITEGITLEYKGKDAIKLPVQQSPKILITTNYTVGGSGGSFDRRKFEVELSAHFNSNHTPLDEFGHLLFDDWKQDEWDKFDSFMIQCLQYYLMNGLKSYKHKNLKTRKFIKSTCQEFYEWTQDDNLKFNKQLDKKDLYTQFKDEHSDLKWMTQRTFTRWIEEYAKHNKFETLSGRTHSTRWIMIQNHDAPQDDEIDQDLPF